MSTRAEEQAVPRPSAPGPDEALPRFNWGAFLIPPVWGVAHGQWAGVFFLPAWAFADNVVRGPVGEGRLRIVGWFMLAATLGLQFVYARFANRIAWAASRDRMSVEVFLRRQRRWARAGVIVSAFMLVWVVAYVARYGAALPVR